MPQRIETIKEPGYTIFAVIGALFFPAFQFLYGEGEARIVMMFFIALLIVMDWIAGSNASDKDGSYASEYGIKGIWRTLFILMVPIAGNLIDQITNLQYGLFFGIFSFGLMYHIGKSATANAIRSGWGNWLPIDIFQAVLGWAKNEIDHKTARALQRKAERDNSLLKNEDHLPKK